MTGNDMRYLRKLAGLTQAEMAEHAGLSRKSINEAEAMDDEFVERRTEAAVRALTQVAKARARLLAQEAVGRAEGDRETQEIFGYAATLLTGRFVDDEQTIYNLAVAASRLSAEVEKLRSERA